MRMAQFVRADGGTLQLNQVTSWARVDNNGTQLTVWVVAAPHHGQIPSGPGLYAGSVSLDSATVQGAQVPVRIHVAYQNVNLIFAIGLLAAFGGFIWAMLLHSATGGPAKQGYLFRNVTLCLAVLLAAAIPVVNVQVLSKPDWQGTLSQFIGLGTLIGAAAIATTPTLRALVIPTSLRRKSSSQPSRGNQAPNDGEAPGGGPAQAGNPAQPGNPAQADGLAQPGNPAQAGNPAQGDGLAPGEQVIGGGA
jgi:hypothetical protein